jgi:hypothetical protein
MAETMSAPVSRVCTCGERGPTADLLERAKIPDQHAPPRVAAVEEVGVGATWPIAWRGGAAAGTIHAQAVDNILE